MGGVLIVIAILLPTVLWSDPANPFVWIAVLSTLAFGAIGFADDYIKVVITPQPRPHRARQAVLAEAVAGAASRLRWSSSRSSAVLHAAQRAVHQEPGTRICMWHIGRRPFRILGFLAFVPFVAVRHLLS